ncbi:hypothetical protein J31TS6_22840 [Brevibacillus reuszeri]|uniref:hypothetical protein n=1 Tax=Brevibacillus reuszeri TaxID=54915 RepID=UPI001B10C8E3|nr:hypothetical protein [Brevibacillus reuszeri]GIO06256.1 hypothetical protein J31TS6_22840 [Brevibacillus reuszeri]
MREQVLDFQEHVDQTEPLRQKQLEKLAFDSDEDMGQLDWTVRDVIEELEFLVDLRATMTNEDFLDGVKEQARRLLK